MRPGWVVDAFVVGLLGLSVLVLATTCAVLPPTGHPKYNCTRVGFKNEAPEAYYGALVCDVKILAEPPTEAELRNIYTCLTANKVEFTPDLTGWSYYTASDIVVYPTSKSQLILGVTIEPEKAIYVRENHYPKGWPTLQRGVLYHEIIHAVRPGKEDHDSVFYTCTLQGYVA